MRKRSETKVQIIDVADVRAKLLEAEEQLNSVFINRREVIRVMIIAHLIRQHYLLVGTPGTAKTAIATCFAKHITGATYFKTMLGSFSSPEKVFGPLDIDKFKKGRYEHVTEGKLAAVVFAFLDEFFKANEATLNELLTALNEREFGGQKIPLQTCGMATNWPEVISRTNNTNALYDRCLLRVEVRDVETKEDMVKVLQAVDEVEVYEPDPEGTITLAELTEVQNSVAELELSDEVRLMLADVRDKLATRMVGGQKKPHIEISSRRLGALQKAMRASAWLAGRKEVGVADFDVLKFGLWNNWGEQQQVTAVLNTIDSAIVQAIATKIDKARSEYAKLQDSDFGTTRVTAVTELFGETIAEVKKTTARPVFTTNGMEMVKKAMARFVADFKAMNEREKQFVAKMSEEG